MKEFFVMNACNRQHIETKDVVRETDCAYNICKLIVSIIEISDI